MGTTAGFSEKMSKTQSRDTLGLPTRLEVHVQSISEIRIPIIIDLRINLEVGTERITQEIRPVVINVPTKKEDPCMPLDEKDEILPSKPKRTGRPPGWKPGESYTRAWDRLEKKSEEKQPEIKYLPGTDPNVCAACGVPFNQYQPVNIMDGNRYHLHCKKNVIRA